MYVIKYKANKGIVVVVVVRKLHSGFFFFFRTPEVKGCKFS